MASFSIRFIWPEQVPKIIKLMLSAKVGWISGILIFLSFGSPWKPGLFVEVPYKRDHFSSTLIRSWKRAVKHLSVLVSTWTKKRVKHIEFFSFSILLRKKTRTSEYLVDSILRKKLWIKVREIVCELKIWAVNKNQIVGILGFLRFVGGNLFDADKCNKSQVEICPLSKPSGFINQSINFEA